MNVVSVAFEYDRNHRARSAAPLWAHQPLNPSFVTGASLGGETGFPAHREEVNRCLPRNA